MSFFDKVKKLGHRRRRHGDRLAASSAAEGTPSNSSQASNIDLSSPGASSSTTPIRKDLKTGESQEPSPPPAVQVVQKVPSGPVSQPPIPAASPTASQAVSPSTDASPMGASGASEKRHLSQDLWNDAYDSIEKDETKIADAYRDTLAKALTDLKLKDVRSKKTTPESENISAEEIERIRTEISAELKDRTKRQEYMQRFVKDGKNKVAKGSAVIVGVGAVAEALLSAKPVVDLVLNNVPQAAPAAIPWAGVCIGLEILSKPGKSTKSNLDGIAHVTSRMEWYDAMSGRLLDEGGGAAGGESFEAAQKLLRDKVLELYKAILLYQMRSVCTYYRNQGVVFLRALVDLDKWDGSLQSVKDAEKSLLGDWETYDSTKASSLRSELVVHAKGTEEQLKAIHQDLREFFYQQQIEQAKSENRKLLADLRVINSQDHMQTIEEEKEKDGLITDAYDWILEDKRYRAFTSWDETNTSDHDSPIRLLWIKGNAGTGKTMLLIGIIRTLTNQVAGFAPNLSYFFCRGTDNRLNTATAVLRSLIWMLVIQQADLISHLLHDYNMSGSSFFTDKEAWSALSRVFKEMVKDARRVYLIVDALDECEQGLEHIVKLISTSLPLSDKVRWLVSSRPDGILNSLETDIGATVIELDEKTLDIPVKTYINHKLNSLHGRPGYSDEVLDNISQEIGNRAENTFLWVWHVFHVLASEKGWNAIEVIDEMPSKLSELYDHIRHKMEVTTGRDFSHCKKALLAACLAYRPLALPELAVVAGLPQGVDVETIVEECGSFLRTSDERVHMVHQSAKDYLADDLAKGSESWFQPGGPAQGHADLCRHSIAAMEKLLKRDMFNLRELGIDRLDIVPRPDHFDLLAPIRYSCLFWLDHWHGASEGGQKRVPDDEVYTFFQTHFLHWLESICLMGELSDVIVSMKELLQALRVDEHAAFHAFIYDANKFILYNRSTIETFPLQIYCSALLFTPHTSITRKQFEDQIPPLFLSLPVVSTHWSALEQTLEHFSSVLCVAFAHGEGILAAASDKGFIRLWDIDTGAVAARTIATSQDSIQSLAFSLDDMKLTSAFADGTTATWNLETGDMEGAHTRYKLSQVRIITLSCDGAMMAWSSEENALQAWRIDDGRVENMLGNRPDWLERVLFSPDGTKMAWTWPRDTAVRISDVATGHVEHTLEGHGKKIRGMAFSGDGAKLALLAWNQVVRVWNCVTGEAEQIVGDDADDADDAAPFNDKIVTIALSYDGAKLSLGGGNDNYHVEVWDVPTGRLEARLEGHEGNIESLAFSRCGSKLAFSGRWDGTVSVWNLASGEAERTFGHTGKRRILDIAEMEIERTRQLSNFRPVHSGRSGCVTFLHDDAKLASAAPNATLRILDIAAMKIERTRELSNFTTEFASNSADLSKSVVQMLALAGEENTIDLYNTATDQVERSLNGHPEPAAVVAFSHDGSRLASGYDGNEAILWSVSTGKLEYVLMHPGSVRAVAFSKDDTLLASGCQDKAVRIWDVATGEVEQTLKGHSSWITSVGFSLDGRSLTSVSADSTIRVWSIATGHTEKILQGYVGWLADSALSPDSTKLACGCPDGTVQLWDVATGQVQHTYGSHSEKVTSLTFSSDGAKLASGSYNAVRVWDIATEETLLSFSGSLGRVDNLAFLHDNTKLALGCFNFTVRVWDVGTGNVDRQLGAICGPVSSMRATPGGDSVDLVIGSEDGTVRVWDTHTGVVRQEFSAAGQVTDAAFNHDQTIVLCASVNNSVRLANLATGGVERLLKGHSDLITAIVFSPTSGLLASASNDRTVKVWDISSREAKKTLLHSHPVDIITFSHNGTKLASVSGGSIVQVWDVATGIAEQILTLRSETIDCIAFSPDGAVLAFSGGGDGARLWDLATEKVERLQWDSWGYLRVIAFSIDGTKLVSVRGDDVLRVWNTTRGKADDATEGLSGEVTAVAFSSDGSKVASGSWNGALRLWDVATGNIDMNLNAHTSYITALAFSHDDSRLASGSSDNTVFVWNLSSGKVEKTLIHPSHLNCVAFLHDDAKLVSSCYDGEMRLWDLETEAVIRTQQSMGRYAVTIALSRDDIWVALHELEVVSVWNLQTGQYGRLTIKRDNGSWRELTFSHDSTKLASTSDDEIQVWDLERDLQQTEEKEPTGASTPAGVVDETWPDDGTHLRPSYLVDRYDGWLSRDGMKFLYLPIDYRPSEFATMGNNIAIGTDNGRVIIIRMKEGAQLHL